MILTPRKFNTFLFFKLPSAFICGVRVVALGVDSCSVTVRHRWINQNPFKSMFWAVQGMAAELSAGALVTQAVKASGANISMLVASNKAVFSKKATGKITFACKDGALLKETIDNTIKTGEGQTIWMTSVGVNQEGVTVSTFDFEWTLKVRSQKSN